MGELIAFVEEETLLVDDPLFTNNAVEQYLDWTDKSSKRGSTKYFVTLTKEKDNQKQVQSRCLCARRFMTLMLATAIRSWKLVTGRSF